MRGEIEATWWRKRRVKREKEDRGEQEEKRGSQKERYRSSK